MAASNGFYVRAAGEALSAARFVDFDGAVIGHALESVAKGALFVPWLGCFAVGAVPPDSQSFDEDKPEHMVAFEAAKKRAGALFIVPATTDTNTGAGAEEWWRNGAAWGDGESRDLNTWIANPRASAFANELIACEPQVIPVPVDDTDASPLNQRPGKERLPSWSDTISERHLVHLPLEKKLFTDDVGTPGVVVTPQARAVWARVREILSRPPLPLKPDAAEVAERTRLAELGMTLGPCVPIVIGSPGIGKSRSTAYLLKNLLMTTNDPVLIFHQRVNLVVLLVKQDGVVSGYSMEGTDFKASKCPMVMAERAWIIADAAHVAGKCGYPFIPGRTVLVCSPDASHFDESVKTHGYKLYMPAWTMQQLLAGKDIMGPLLGNDVVKRAGIVGPIPRRVFDHGRWLDFKLTLEDNATLQDPDVVRVLTGTPVETLSKVKPVSATFMFDSSDANFNVLSVVVRVVSPFVAQQLARWTAGTVLAQINSALSLQRRALGELFEQLAFWFLSQGGPMTLTRVADKVEVHASRPTSRSNVGPPWPGIPDRVRALEEVPARGAPPVLYVTASNCPHIDAYDASNRVYQVTIAKQKAAIVLPATYPALDYFVFVVPPGSKLVAPTVTHASAGGAVPTYYLTLPEIGDQGWANVELLEADEELAEEAAEAGLKPVKNAKKAAQKRVKTAAEATAARASAAAARAKAQADARAMRAKRKRDKAESSASDVEQPATKKRKVKAS